MATKKETTPVDAAIEPGIAQPIAAQAVPSPIEQRLLEENRLLKRTVDELGQTMQRQDGLITELRNRLDVLAGQVGELERANPKGIIATAPIPLTGTEAIDAMASNSSVTFVTLAEYAPLGLRPGQKFEGRQKFQGPRVVASHITGGLKIAIAA
jgi:hypothetical protein